MEYKKNHPNTFDESLNKRGDVQRSKFFFGARYLWTEEHKKDPDHLIASGVRLDVPTAPKWMLDMED